MRAKKLLVVIALIMSATCATAQSPYRTVTVSNGGSISGNVKWVGAPVKPLLRPVTKNPEICDPGNNKTVDLRRLLIGPDNGVENTVVFLNDVHSGKPMNLPAARASLNQKTCRYEPHVLLVPVGGQLKMTNSDPILHNIHMTGAALYNLPFPLKDHEISRVMRKEGVVDLKCDAGHVWMNAEIVVAANPYYAVTDAHGDFKLTDVPPGEYEIVAWHEGWEIAREEPMMDVDAHQEVRRPIFSDPKVWRQKVSVVSAADTKVNFELAEK